jgi:hypothetical protein
MISCLWLDLHISHACVDLLAVPLVDNEQGVCLVPLQAATAAVQDLFSERHSSWLTPFAKQLEKKLVVNPGSQRKVSLLRSTRRFAEPCVFTCTLLPI